MNVRMYFGVEERLGNIGKETMKELSIPVINAIIIHSVITVLYNTLYKNMLILTYVKLH